MTSNFLDCPVKIIEKSVVKTLLSATYLPEECLGQLYIQNSKGKETQIFYNQTNRTEPSALGSSEDEFIEQEDSCIPRFQLARVKHPQPFSDVYLLQVRKNH